MKWFQTPLQAVSSQRPSTRAIVSYIIDYLIIMQVDTTAEQSSTGTNMRQSPRRHLWPSGQTRHPFCSAFLTERHHDSISLCRAREGAYRPGSRDIRSLSRRCHRCLHAIHRRNLLSSPQRHPWSCQIHLDPSIVGAELWLVRSSLGSRCRLRDYGNPEEPLWKTSPRSDRSMSTQDRLR